MKFKKLDEIVKLNNGFIQTSEATEQGISRAYFLEYVKEKEMIRVAHGLYMTEDTWDDQIFVLQVRYPGAIFSHETSAFMLNLSEREPFRISLTLPTGTGSSRLNKEGIEVYKIKEELFDLGLIETQTTSGNKVRSYNMERTFCDLVRNRNNIEFQELQSFIKSYFQNKERDIPKLMRYAKKFSVEKIIRRYMEILV